MKHTLSMYLLWNANLTGCSFICSPTSDTSGNLISGLKGLSYLPVQCLFPIWRCWGPERSSGLFAKFTWSGWCSYLPFGFPQWISGKESSCDAGGVSSIHGLERSPGRGYGNPLQYSCLRNPIDRGAWQASVHRVAKSQTQLKQLSTHHYTFLLGQDWLIKH